MLKSTNYKIRGLPSEPITVEQKTELLTSLVPVVTEHVFAVGKDRNIPDAQLATFVVNIIDPNFTGDKPEQVLVEV